MSSILFLGYSNLVKNRILPIISKLNLNGIAIAKYEGQEWDEDCQKYDFHITRYDNYDDGISAFDGDLVYVSTVNSSHAEYARKSLLAGFNTIVDKPATITLSETQDLIKIAQQNNLFLGESTVYLQHPQLGSIVRIFEDNLDEPKALSVHFTMPPFNPSNFRYKKELGGGAILDTAPYAVSIGRYFFGNKPEKVTCHILERNDDGIETQYSLMMEYPNGKSFIGYFGFNTEYLNQILLLGTRTNVLVNRIFTIPDSLENNLIVNRNNKVLSIKVSAANNFELYLNDVLAVLPTGNYNKSYNNMLYDAEVRSMILNNIK